VENYLAIVPKHDVPGKAAIGFHITGWSDFAGLYKQLELENAAVVINLTKLKLINRIMGALGAV
jgi:hypothetical protein